MLLDQRVRRGGSHHQKLVVLRHPGKAPDLVLHGDGMVEGCAHPMGPLALCDFIGLDIIHGICASLYEEHKRDEYAAPPLLRPMVSSGHLGRKTDRGFYEYPAVLAGSGARP